MAFAKKYLIVFVGLLFFLVLTFYGFQKENLLLPIQVAVGLFGIVLFSYTLKEIKQVHLLMVFSVPLSFDLVIGSGGKISMASEIILLVLISMIVIKMLWGLKVSFGFLNHPISIILLTQITWSILGCFTAEITEVSIKRVLTNSLYFIGFYASHIVFSKNDKDNSNIPFFYCLGMIIPIIWSFYIHSEWGFSQPSSIHVSEPFYSDHTIYAACLAMIFPFVIYKTIKKQKSLYGTLLYLMLCIIILLAIITSYSRAAWISLVLAGILFICIRLRIKFYQLMLVLTVGAVMFALNFSSIYDQFKQTEIKYDNNITTHITTVTNLKNDASNLERINRWVCAYRMFGDRPIFGFGSGNYQFVYDRYQTVEFMTRISTHKGNKGNAHSEYMTALSENGIVGLFLFTGLVLFSVYKCMNLIYSERTSKLQKEILLFTLLGLVTFYIHGFFNTFSDTEKLSVLLFCFLGTIVSIDLRTKISNQDSYD